MSRVNLSSYEGENSCCESDEEFGNESKKSRQRMKCDISQSSSTASSRGTEVGFVENPVPGASLMSTYNEERMRKKLQFFFMNPIEKWHAKKRFPYKFVVQVLKLIFVTLQLCLFAYFRYSHVNYTWDNRISFSHLFLKGWDSSMEVIAYPPPTGPLAVYEKAEFFNTIDYAVVGYANLTRSIGSYSYPSKDNQMAPMKLCMYMYKQGEIFGFNESYIFNPEIVKKCINLTETVTTMGSEAFLANNNVTINFSALVKANLKFGIKTVNFKAYGPLTAPDCYKFEIVIFFDNRDHDGQLKLWLDADAIRLHCQGDVQYIKDTELDAALRSILNILVILICMGSFVLCARALIRAQILRKQTSDFFIVTYKKDLSFEGKMEFVNFWYIMILCNDILLMIGSALKEQIERKLFVTDGWDMCSVLLGVGNLLVWFGVLRYLGFFRTYNVVILTLKKATPSMLRFLLCAIMIYAGFTFCGWLILGPYHMKFRSLSTTSECLFSLINGDDMFATFTTMSSKSPLMWWFSRLYLYSFIGLYIYVILSLFISVIMDAYDTIKRYYREGFPQSDLQEFIGPKMSMDSFQSNLDEEDIGVLKNWAKRICCCIGIRRESPGPTGYTTLNVKNHS